MIFHLEPYELLRATTVSVGLLWPHEGSHHAPRVAGRGHFGCYVTGPRDTIFSRYKFGAEIQFSWRLNVELSILRMCVWYRGKENQDENQSSQISLRPFYPEFLQKELSPSNPFSCAKAQTSIWFPSPVNL